MHKKCTASCDLCSYSSANYYSNTRNRYQLHGLYMNNETHAQQVLETSLWWSELSCSWYSSSSLHPLLATMSMFGWLLRCTCLEVCKFHTSINDPYWNSCDSCHKGQCAGARVRTSRWPCHVDSVALCELPIFLHALREMGTAGKQAALALKKRTQTILPQRHYCVCSLMATRGVNHDAQGGEESPIRARVWSARDRIVHSNNNF